MGSIQDLLSIIEAISNREGIKLEIKNITGDIVEIKIQKQQKEIHRIARYLAIELQSLGYDAYSNGKSVIVKI